MNWETYLEYVKNEVIPRFSEILITPWMNKETLWMVIPLILIMFFIQAYYGRNKTEDLGWDTAFGNAVSLFWVSILLFKFMIENTSPIELFESGALRSLILIGILFAWTLLLLVSDYFHALPKRVAFLLSSDIPINATAYIFIVLIIGNIPLDTTTLLAGLFFLLYIAIFFRLFRTIIKPSETAQRTLSKRHKKKLQEKQIKRERRKEKVNHLKEKTINFFDLLKPREPRV